MRFRLATKISATIVGVLALALASSILGVILAYGFESTTQSILDENLASVRAAEELEIALLEQRGYVSSYILDDGDSKWLAQLRSKEGAFDYWMRRAGAAARTFEERSILARLNEVHRSYDRKRDEAVSLYEAGAMEESKRILLNDVNDLYQQAYQLCEDYLAANNRYVNAASERTRARVEQMSLAISLCAGLTVALGVVLLWMFLYGVLFPLRRMASDAQMFTADSLGGYTPRNELREVALYLKTLMADVTETRSDLARSRTQLASAEKLAAVGKLAASVAHEIRNPLTSIKMWLFSLRRSCGQPQELGEKFDLISEEIGRLESIIRHFLEFSRPPDLKASVQHMPRLLDNTLELLRHRLQQSGVEVERRDDPNLPPVMADAEQLKQVFINLMENAIEAMPDGGRIAITSSAVNSGAPPGVLVRVADSGAGMPVEVQRRIFEPFFSSKPQGTGLGLCIAASVVSRHNGRLTLESSSGQGTVFAVQLPAARE
jgi:signal transduction histidine kinase